MAMPVPCENRDAMDQLQAMRVFVRVVEAGNFTRAADSLGLPKATVTKQIQSLESRLRTRLLNRTTRRVSVTPDGAAYYERTARLLGDFDDIEASMVNAQAAPRGRLRIDATSTIARLVLMPALPAFLSRYPDIELDMGVSDRVVDLIGDNVDVVLRGGQIEDQSLVARRIGLLRFVTVASPAYLARHGTPTKPSDLERRHLMVGYFMAGPRRQLPMVFERDGEQIEVSPHTRLAINEGNAHLAAILSGFGVSQTLSYIAEPHIAAGELVPILTDWTRPPVPIYVVYPPNRHLSAKVRVFVDWVAELFGADPRLRIGNPAVGNVAVGNAPVASRGRSGSAGQRPSQPGDLDGVGGAALEVVRHLEGTGDAGGDGIVMDGGDAGAGVVVVPETEAGPSGRPRAAG